MNKLFLLILMFTYSSMLAQKSPLIRIEIENSALVLKVGENQKCYRIFGTNNLFKPAITDGNSSLEKSSIQKNR